MSVSNFTEEIKKRNNGSANGCQQNQAQGVPAVASGWEMWGPRNGQSITRPREKDDVWEREDKC